jgi:hypothetical protein
MPFVNGIQQDHLAHSRAAEDELPWSRIHMDPAAVGLELVAEVDAYEEAYEFHLVTVWRLLEDGQLLGATDTGCSCPMPYEDVRGRDDLAEINSIADLEPLFRDAVTSAYREPRLKAIHEFRQTVRRAL